MRVSACISSCCNDEILGSYHIVTEANYISHTPLEKTIAIKHLVHNSSGVENTTVDLGNSLLTSKTTLMSSSLEGKRHGDSIEYRRVKNSATTSTALSRIGTFLA
ncbi:hypothetical protein FRB91_007177, partial [Serendipita sp. 411]